MKKKRNLWGSIRLIPFQRWLKVMKLLSVCMLGFALSLHASVYSQNSKVSFEMTKVTLNEVFMEMGKQTDVEFLYNHSDMKKIQVKELKVSDKEFMELLEELLPQYGLEYSFSRNVVLIKEKTAPQERKERWAQGKVVDKGGNPIPGVTVVLKGTTLGVVSGTDGAFRIMLPDSDARVLLFSFVGMLTQEIVWQGQEMLTVVMEEDAAEIGEVVVTGIFDRPRESYTGAVTMVSEKELKMYRGQNLLTTLRNIDPAINIVADNVAGSNPNRELEVNIRGNSSLPMNIEDLGESASRQLNTPLVIVDGFEVSIQKLSDFNDEEIESINILKDASATSIYGSRGANGVIVVKTRSPKPGQLRIFVQGGLNLEIPELSSYDLLGAQDKLKLERMVGLYDAEKDPDRDRRLKEIYNIRWAEALKGETDWLKEPLRVGTGQRLNLRLEGGSEEFRWSVSIGNNLVKGAMKTSERNTTNASITLSYQLKNLLFRNQANYDYTLADNGRYGSFSTYVAMNPYNRARDENGNLIKSWIGWSTSSTPSSIYNPLVDAELNSKNESKTNTISDVFSIDWQVLPSLNVRGQMGISKSFMRSDVYVPGEHSSFRTVYYTTGDGFFRKGTYLYTDGESMSLDGSITLSYSKVFKQKHVLYAGFNAEIAQSESNSYIIKAEGLLNQDFNDLTNALQYAEGTVPAGKDSKTSRLGFTGNVNYTYDNRYFVDGSLRLDGSSQFGTNNKYAPFWSLGVGWNMHNEKFMRNLPVVDVLRLRVAYGQTGSQQFSAYQAKSMYEFLTSTRYLFWTAAELMGLGNEDLKWQRTDQWNGGIEAQLLKNRLSLGFDVYYKVTSNLLSEIDIPQSHGFRSYAENVGEVKNSGFEAMLGGYIIRNTEREIMWNVTGKVAYTKNEVTRLSEAIKDQVEALRETSETDRLLYEGHAQNSIYAVRSLGIDPVDGREMFLDRDGYVTKTWKARDRVYCGVAEPTYRGTLSSLLSYKDFSVNLSFAFHWGGKQYNETLINKVEVTNYMIQDGNVDQRVFSERWQEAGDLKPFKGYGNSKTRHSSRFVMDDNVFQLQSVSLQYRWRTPFVKNSLRADAVNFSVNMSDLFYISSIKRERGTAYPFARNLQMAVSLSF